MESLRQRPGRFLRAACSRACDTPAPSRPDEWRMRCNYHRRRPRPVHGICAWSPRGDERWAIIDARGQRAAAAPFRGDRELVSAVLIVRLLVLVGLDRRHGVAAGQPIEQILVLATAGAEWPQGRLSRPPADRAPRRRFAGAAGDDHRPCARPRVPARRRAASRRPRAPAQQPSPPARLVPSRRALEQELAPPARRRARTTGTVAARSPASTRSAAIRGDGSRPLPPQRRMGPGTAPPAARRAARG